MDSRTFCSKVPAGYLPATAAAVLQADKRNNTPLHAVASCRGGAEQHAAIAYLLLHKSDARLLCVRNRSGNTAYDVAMNTSHAGVIPAVQAWGFTDAELCWQDSYSQQFDLSIPTTPTGAQLANKWDWGQALLKIADSSSCNTTHDGATTTYSKQQPQQQQQEKETRVNDLVLSPPPTPADRAQTPLQRLAIPTAWAMGLRSDLHSW